MAALDLFIPIFDLIAMSAPLTPEPAYFSRQVAQARRFYLNPGRLAARAGEEPTPLYSAGREVCLPEYDLHRPGFFCPIVEFVERGSGRLELGGREYLLRPGTLFTYGRGMAHRIVANQEEPSQPLTKYFVAMRESTMGAFLQECRLTPGCVLEVSHPERITTIFDDLIEHGLSDHTRRARLCQITLQYLLMKIADLAGPYRSLHSAALATYQRCRLLIEEEFLRFRTLREVATACHVDEAYLCRLFRRFRRQSPYEYLQHLQMNHAVDLLQNGRLPVKEVAARLGFPDPYGFSRAFRRVIGVPPGSLLPREGGTAIGTPASDTLPRRKRPNEEENTTHDDPRRRDRSARPDQHSARRR